MQHGTDADTLEKSVGHVVRTSLPVGGSSTHAVLSAHSGLASSKLFSDIDQLAADDMFYIHVLGEVLAYKVDAINTVLPTDTHLLQIEDGKDYVTLVTCTPFGVNTHRLLVRGHRIPYTPEQATAAAVEKPAASSWTRHYLTGLGVGLGAVAVIGGAYFLVRRKRHAYKETVYFGLTARQLICSLLAVGTAVGLYFTLRGVLDRETLGWLCIVGAAPMAAAGFFHYNGLTLEQFLWAWCKTNFLLAGRRLWHSENYLYDLWEEDKK